jgi:hypothetical protein
MPCNVREPSETEFMVQIFEEQSPTDKQKRLKRRTVRQPGRVETGVEVIQCRMKKL